ncbi:uncharacterized protein LOC109540548 [Dendroctonus ponderosae]
MAFSGKYQLIKNEGILEHLVANGMPVEQAQKVEDDNQDLEISVNGDDIKISSRGPLQNLKLNQETTATGPDGKVFKSTASLNGDVLTVVSSFSSHEWTRIYSVSGSELTVTSRSSKSGVPDGKRIYKRI